MITPEQSKSFVQELQRYVVEILRKRIGIELEEALDLANDIVDYSFAIMLKTHKNEEIFVNKNEEIFVNKDDDIPF